MNIQEREWPPIKRLTAEDYASRGLKQPDIRINQGRKTRNPSTTTPKPEIQGWRQVEKGERFEQSEIEIINGKHCVPSSLYPRTAELGTLSFWAGEETKLYANSSSWENNFK